MLTSDIDSLIKEAETARKRAIAPYSRFTVGAALLSASGEIYKGCNIENPSLMMSVCAEKAAILNALIKDEKVFKAMAIVSGDGKYCFPCGACRQMIFEFAGKIEIFIAAAEGIKKYSITELLPHSFKRT